MTNDQRKSWLPLAILGAALTIWAGLLGLGAYFEFGADQPQHDVRKPLFVLGSMAAFLSIWGLALWFRSRRASKK